MARRRRGGIGFTGLLIVCALLYFTGAGDWLWNRMKGFEESCYAMLAQMGTELGSGACAASGSAINSLDSIFSNWDEKIHEYTDQIKRYVSEITTGHGFDSFTRMTTEGLMQGTSPLSGLTSPSEALAQMMRRGPGAVGGGVSASDRVRAALDNFVIGQHYLHDGGDAASAASWFSQGARQPGYGLHSQLALGDLYRYGGDGVAADPLRAQYYYQQALQSVGVLNRAGTPEAQQMLGAMPSSPAQIQQQLTATIADLSKQITKQK